MNRPFNEYIRDERTPITLISNGTVKMATKERDKIMLLYLKKPKDELYIGTLKVKYMTGIKKMLKRHPLIIHYEQNVLTRNSK